MVILPKQYNKEAPHLTVIKKSEQKLWNIFFDHHREVGTSFSHHNNDENKLFDEIVMNKKDLLNFASEIKRILKKGWVKEKEASDKDYNDFGEAIKLIHHKLKAGEDISKKEMRKLDSARKRILIFAKRKEDGRKLRLTFVKNKPQFGVSMRHMKEGDFFYGKTVENGVEFIAYYNNLFSVVRDTRPENQYIYENEEGKRTGGPTGAYQYYLPEELEKFANDLEKEANSA